MQKPSYLHHLDVLRSLSIVFVVFFHLDIDLFKGGFIGVDIFFTISGFIVARSILPKIREKTFSFPNFYKKRVKRLLPAALLLIVLVVIVSLVTFPTEELISVLRSITRILTFQSNFFFQKEFNDYFGTDTTEMPLIHFWSLSIEEQFYLIFPLILVMSHRLLPRFRTNSKILTVGFLFLFYSFWKSYSTPASIYFLTLPRFFQFLFGAAFADYNYKNPAFKNHKIRHLLFGLSLASLVILCCNLSKEDTYPGFWAFVVTLSSIGIILFYPIESFRNLGVFSHFGKLSYSIYLWHWPLIAFCNFLQIDSSLKRNIAILFSTYLLSVLSYFYIENPFRFNSWGYRRAFTLWVIAPLILAMVARHYLPSLGLVKNRYQSFERLATIKKSVEIDCVDKKSGTKFCQTSKDSALPIVLLVGDSHANHFYPFIKEITDLSTNQRLVKLSRGGCASIPGLQNYRSFDCEGFTLELEKFIKKHSSKIRHIIISNNWAGYLKLNFCCNRNNKVEIGEKIFEDLIIRYFEKLRSENYSFTIIETAPYLTKKIRKCMTYPMNLFDSCWNDTKLKMSPNPFTKIFRQYADQHEQISFLDPKKSQCYKGKCLTHADGLSFYHDNHHITRFGAIELGKIHKERFGYEF